MSRLILLVACVLAACDSAPATGRDAAVPGLDAGPPCVPRGPTESTCSDGVDDDCDGFVDCLDSQCDGLACGGHLTCTAGACVTECTDGDGCLPPLGQIDNLRPTVRGDNVLVDFSPVDGARDYRIYVYPDSSRVLTGADGEVVVRDAIYRCSGDRPRLRRDADGINRLNVSLVVNVQGYSRTEDESLLGYVYRTPDVGREAVYRVSDPNLNGGYAWDETAPWGSEYNGGDYVVGTEARDALLARGWRDDGIAFYVPSEGPRTLYRSFYERDGAVLFYTDGPEQAARAEQSQEARFGILAEQAPGSAPLYRVFYSFNHDHDVLAVGDADRDRILYQGSSPLTTLLWSGIHERTTLVVEALDEGCPWPGGFVGPTSSPADLLGGIPSEPHLSLDEARLPSGEVYINGQHETTNRPRAIARAFLTVDPEPRPTMDWYMGFDEEPSPFETAYIDGNGFRIEHNDQMSFELFRAGEDNHAWGTMLGQFWAGSGASFSIVARGVEPQIAADGFLHVTMSTDVASTMRRYPQIYITDTPLDPDFATAGTRVLMQERLGERAFEVPEGAPLSGNHTIIVQTFGREPELQVQFCDGRGWGVSAQCPKANIYGFHAGVGDDHIDWTAPWLPTPVMGDYVGNDRPVRFDVYASTERVYVYIEDRPAGCAILPPGRMPSGRVNVMFGIAAYHIDIDEGVANPDSQHQYWHRHSLAHTDRRLDDLGIESSATLPGWDESVMPCGDRYYANAL